MIRLFKLAVLSLFGYMIYQFVQGLTGTAQQGERARGESSPGESDRSVRRGVGSMTGPGQGQRVQTEDAGGTGASHYVGRGVVK